MRARLRSALAGPVAFLALDLSTVSDCDERLFGVLADIHSTLADRGGWMRLLGLSPAVLDALDTAPIEEVLMVYRTSDLAPERHGAADSAMLIATVAGAGAVAAVEPRPGPVSAPRHAIDR